MRRLAPPGIGWAVSVLTLVVGFGLAASASGQTPPAAENPLHLEELLDAARFEGSAVPADIPQPIEWRFDEPQADWKAPAHRNPYIPPLQMTQTEDALRITLSEAHRDPRADRLHGDFYVPLPDLKRGEWGHVLVRARTSDDIRNLTIVFNLRDPMPDAGQQGGMFQFAGDNVPVIHDGSVQTYRLRADWPPRGGEGPWQELGLVVNAGEPASLDILSVHLVPKEAPFAGAAVGVRTVGAPELPALYTHAPGRLEYRVRVPEAGRLDAVAAKLASRSLRVASLASATEMVRDDDTTPDRETLLASIDVAARLEAGFAKHVLWLQITSRRRTGYRALRDQRRAMCARGGACGRDPHARERVRHLWSRPGRQ